MEKDVRKVLNDFLEECKLILNLESILEFGSSAYTNKFKDIDLMFISNKKIIPSKERLDLIKLIKKFEKIYPEIVFDFAGVNDRSKKGKYFITIVFVSKEFLKTKYNPHDLFFLKILTLNKRIKVLYGFNPFIKLKIKLSNKHLFEMLDHDVLVLLRNSLDDKRKKLSVTYFQFKSFLRAMLIHEGDFKKKDLIKEFKKKYGDKIPLPEDSKRILNHKLKEKDFKNILKFTEDCLNYLVK